MFVSVCVHACVHVYECMDTYVPQHACAGQNKTFWRKFFFLHVVCKDQTQAWWQMLLAAKSTGLSI